MSTRTIDSRSSGAIVGDRIFGSVRKRLGISAMVRQCSARFQAFRLTRQLLVMGIATAGVVVA